MISYGPQIGTEALRELQSVIKTNEFSHLEMDHLKGGGERLGAWVGIRIKIFKFLLMAKEDISCLFYICIYQPGSNCFTDLILINFYFRAKQTASEKLSHS